MKGKKSNRGETWNHRVDNEMTSAKVQDASRFVGKLSIRSELIESICIQPQPPLARPPHPKKLIMDAA